MARKESTNSLPCGRPAPQKSTFAQLSAAQGRQKLGDYIKSQGLNQSESRNRILEVLFEKPEHFTVPELIKRVQKSHPSIGPATVYRTIPVLIGAGILSETLTNSEGQAVYEVAESEHHDHIVCLDCNAIIEFHEAGIEAKQHTVTQKLGFEEVGHRHVIYARCRYRSK